MGRDTDRIHIDEVIVVEGRDDTSAVLAAVDGITIETHGYGIRKETWDVLEKAYESSGLIIFTDPDPAGERIRRRLAERFPNAKHAFMEKNDAKKGEDIGIENAAPGDIRRALAAARDPVEVPEEGISVGKPGKSTTTGNSRGKEPVEVERAATNPGSGFTMRDMDYWGLNGTEGAASRRRELGKELCVGFAGAKTFLKRLNHLGVTREEIEVALDTLQKSQ